MPWFANYTKIPPLLSKDFIEPPTFPQICMSVRNNFINFLFKKKLFTYLIIYSNYSIQSLADNRLRTVAVYSHPSASKH